MAVIRFLSIFITVIIACFVGWYASQLQEQRSKELVARFAHDFTACIYEYDTKEFSDWAAEQKIQEYKSVEELMAEINDAWDKRVSFLAQKCIPKAERLAFESSQEGTKSAIFGRIIGDQNAQSAFFQNIAISLLFLFLGIGLEAVIFRQRRG